MENWKNIKGKESKKDKTSSRFLGPPLYLNLSKTLFTIFFM
jgi:hypothetical protein